MGITITKNTPPRKLDLGDPLGLTMNLMHLPQQAPKTIEKVIQQPPKIKIPERLWYQELGLLMKVSIDSPT
jgi:hypothetical protein